MEGSEVAGPQAPLASMSLALSSSRNSSLALRTRQAPASSAPSRGVKLPQNVTLRRTEDEDTNASLVVPRRPSRKPFRPAAAAGQLLRVLASIAPKVAIGVAAVGLYKARKSAMRLIPGLLRKPIDNGTSGGPGSGGGRGPALLWFRNDLRLHDHEALVAANQACTSLLPVYCFDPREYGKGPSGFDKTGPYRAQFILDSIADLRARLCKLGSDLVVRVGRPEQVLPELVRAVQAGAVYCHGEVAYEDWQVEQSVQRAVHAEGAELHVVWGGTLYHMDDLPFKLPAMPASYGDFKDKLKAVNIRSSVAAPTGVKGVPMGGNVDAGEMPSMQQLGFSAEAEVRARQGPVAGEQLRGGESQALQHLQAFMSELARQQASSQAPPSSSRQHLSTSFSAKISPWLAMGCLSPRHMFQQLQQQPQPPAAAGASPGAGSCAAQWLQLELMWRDFFRFITKKYAASGAQAAPGKAAAPAAPALAVA